MARLFDDDKQVGRLQSYFDDIDVKRRKFSRSLTTFSQTREADQAMEQG
eukprot:CAMPEP_0175771306 /NCGR_PEP_ID=MMETSP0097-20121207/71955_1 /TAXON_ID=311494 /ORGANISM="Alexandrium monilatum, Strain CCMP3105" /LENGTH=48 /DNA_ID= /DNA_START= /DNA_END= /DNA_ORIENTATION=